MVQDAQQRAALGIPPLPLDAAQTAALCQRLQTAGSTPDDRRLLQERVPPGVDPAAYVKAGFLGEVAQSRLTSPQIDPLAAVQMLGQMVGGYNVPILIELLQSNDSVIAQAAQEALSRITLVYDAFNDIWELAPTNAYAKGVIDAWAEAVWFTEKPVLPEVLPLTVFKVSGEINTDDLSPAVHATTRPDIPLHALTMLETRAPGALAQMQALKQLGHPLAFVGDVVGTGSSRKSAINSLLWHIGEDIPAVPNKRRGGVILGGTIA
ncbi:MAG: aconitate hydratase B, partial [Gloeomargarita sp. DG_2_bins_126]